MSIRAYKFNQSDLQKLFATIIESLGAPEQPEDIIQRILEEVCLHFHFGCGFVYEADHTGSYNLRERYALYDTRALPQSFRLDELLCPEQIDELRKNSVLHRHTDSDGLCRGKQPIFESNTFMLVPVPGKEGSPIGLVGMMDRRRHILLDEQAVQAAKTVLNLLANDVKLRIYQRNLEFAKRSLMSILDNTGVDIYVNDFETHEILYANESMAKPYGGLDKILGKKCWEAIYNDKTGPCDFCPQKKLVDENGRPTKIFSWDYQRPFDGAWFRVLSAAFRWVDGRLANVVSSVDITENKNNEALIARMANFDTLTGLPNRRKLIKDCDEAIRERNGKPGQGWFMFFDLDGFKKLNDGVGHLAGDELLRTIGETLQKNPAVKGRVYRYGGDEFIILLPGAERSEVDAVVEFLLDRFSRPWKLRDASPVCRASIGVARFPEDAATTDELLQQGDMMMYQAKRAGGGTARFTTGETIRGRVSSL